MGAWGPGIFSDDTAADVRDDFKELIGEGVDAQEATRRLTESWRDTIEDADEGPVFWITLAATQYSMGRLQDDVRDRALAVIDSGEDLRRWQEDATAADVAKRRRNLEKLREQLLGRQKPQTTVRAAYNEVTDWQPGQYWAYRLQSGAWIVFRVIALDTTLSKGSLPIVQILDRVWSSVPTLEDSAPVAARTHSGYDHGLDNPVRPADAIILARMTKTDFPAARLMLVGEGPLPARPSRRTFWSRKSDALPERIPPLEFWKLLDDSLQKHWDLT